MFQKWKIECLFWLGSFLVALLIMLPIHDHLQQNYPYYLVNYIFIILFLTYTRYIFLLHYAPFSHTLWIKMILIFASIPLFLWLIDDLYDFLEMLDIEGIEPLVRIENLENKYNMAKYVKYQFIFFSVGCLITIAMLPIRMIVSIWRVRNKGTV
jgi:hypothetical protein